MTLTAGLRIAGAVMAAMATALVLLIAVELYSSIVHPFPPGFDGSTEELCRHVEQYPHWVLASAVLIWGFIAFISTWIAGRWGNRFCALLVGLLLIAAVICNVSMLPYTIWFKIVMPIVIAAAVLYAYTLSPGRRAAAAT